MINILTLKNRAEFREWLAKNSQAKTECWVELKRGKPKDDNSLWYLDAVEEALCFGWIDSTFKKSDGRCLQRFSPRKKNGLWTELNKERVRRLIKLGLMTDFGKSVIPDLSVNSFAIDKDVENALKSAEVWERFISFPPLYQRVRAYNVAFYKGRNTTAYQKALDHLIEQTRQGKMFGNWNDYGRLLDY